MFLTSRFYIIVGMIAMVIAGGVLFTPLFTIGKVLLIFLALAVAIDVVMLYTHVQLTASRKCPEKLSMGDDNEVKVNVESQTAMTLHLLVVDELPKQLQWRNFGINGIIPAGGTTQLKYKLRPVTRGEYEFGRLLVFAATPMRLVRRRFACDGPFTAKVYPSFLFLRKFELMAATNNLVEIGVKKVRRIGHNTEFEQIRDYVQGDDYRTINWKASARRSHLMVNAYQDERAQQVFSVIDKGRLMQQAFEGMTFLDYAINATLVLSHVIINKQDKAGLVTFANTFGSFVPAERHSTQMQRILEQLYNQKTTFGESDYSMLCPMLNRLVPRRSFMMLYTNFTDFESLKRQLPYLRQINQRHRLLVVFFQDVELEQYTSTPSNTGEEYYQHVIAEKLVYERRLITHTLRQNGIFSLLVTPKQLSVEVINKYLEMKSRQLLV